LCFSMYFSEKKYMYIINFIIPSHTKNLIRLLTNLQCYSFTFTHSLGWRVVSSKCCDQHLKETLQQSWYPHSCLHTNDADELEASHTHV